MCGLGRLYSKQNIIEALLEKEKMPETANHIKTLKDIRDLNMTPNPAYCSDDNQKDTIHDSRSAPFICALIGLEMSGKFRFVALWTCGCVFSERALKEIKSSVCPVCQLAYNEQDVVVLNGTEDEMSMLQVKMEMRTARLLAEKKAKKDKKSKSAATATVTSETVTTVQEVLRDDFFKLPASVAPAKLTDKIKTEPNNQIKSETYIKVKTETSVKIKTETIQKIKSEPSSSKVKGSMVSTSKPSAVLSKLSKRAIICDKISDDPVFKKSKNNYSVAKDPGATEVYKSLFTSHDDEKSQDRAHWVTYNPFYN
jgi:hypothetical protein